MSSSFPNNMLHSSSSTFTRPRKRQQWTVNKNDSNKKENVRREAAAREQAKKIEEVRKLALQAEKIKQAEKQKRATEQAQTVKDTVKFVQDALPSPSKKR